MVELEKLKTLEKNPLLDLQECRIIQQDTTDNGHTLYVLEKDGRYFYREEHNDKLLFCNEMVVDWLPFGGMYTVYAFTPDDLHVYQVETGRERLGHFTIQKLNPALIQPGMKCSYYGNTLEYIDENHLSFDGHIVRVDPDPEFTYKALETKIRATDGAKGLFRFLEQVAEEGKYCRCPFWCTAWWKFFEKYAPKK